MMRRLGVVAFLPGIPEGCGENSNLGWLPLLNKACLSPHQGFLRFPRFCGAISYEDYSMTKQQPNLHFQIGGNWVVSGQLIDSRAQE